jgi:integrase
VARLVKPPEHTPRERDTWSKAEVRKFLAKVSSDRLYVAWRLSLYGLRRGEVLGLRWSDIGETIIRPHSTEISSGTRALACSSSKVSG